MKRADARVRRRLFQQNMMGRLERRSSSIFPVRSGWPETALFVGFLAILLLTGGSSRPDASSQLWVRLFSVMFGAIAAFRITGEDFDLVRVPVFILLSLGALMLLQLIPLPPTIWQVLSGREQFKIADSLIGLSSIWRPLSLTPDQTLNAFVSLLPPLAAMLLVAPLLGRRVLLIACALVGLICLTAIWGTFQIATGAKALYTYRFTSQGALVGAFANRNHQAYCLSLAFPLFALLASPGAATPASGKVLQQALLSGGGIIVLLLIVVAGSRGGLVVTLLSMAGSGLIIASGQRRVIATGQRRRPGQWWQPMRIWVVGGVATVVLILVAVSVARAPSLIRLFGEDVSQELRLRLFRPLVSMLLKFFPAGSGFGSFVDVFKIYERPDDLALTYLNHAHNDLLEFLIEGGAPALAIFLISAAWIVRRGASLWSQPVGPTQRYDAARAGLVIVLSLLLASLSDYPLRTPLLGSIFAIALCLVGHRSRVGEGQAVPLRTMAS